MSDTAEQHGTAISGINMKGEYAICIGYVAAYKIMEVSMSHV